MGRVIPPPPLGSRISGLPDLAVESRGAGYIDDDPPFPRFPWAGLRSSPGLHLLATLKDTDQV